jgi:hypothetical protein
MSRACTVCKTRLGRHADAIHITQTNDAGVTTESSLCLPCALRVQRDPVYAERFNDLAKVLTGSIEA